MFDRMLITESRVLAAGVTAWVASLSTFDVSCGVVNTVWAQLEDICVPAYEIRFSAGTHAWLYGPIF